MFLVLLLTFFEKLTNSHNSNYKLKKTIFMYNKKE